MNGKQKLMTTAISGLLAMGLIGAGAQAGADQHDKDAGKEKCYGVAKAGKNDCAANGHACAGQSKRDSNGNEWIYVPAGTCERLINGSTKPKKS